MAYRNYIPEPQYYAPIKVERKTPGRNMFDYLGPVSYTHLTLPTIYSV